MIWIETPTNPLLKLVDIAAVVAAARGRGILVVVDNTFATPWIQRPLELGADIVMHSATKFLNGHSDMVGGVAVVGDAELARAHRLPAERDRRGRRPVRQLPRAAGTQDAAAQDAPLERVRARDRLDGSSATRASSA